MSQLRDDTMCRCQISSTWSWRPIDYRWTTSTIALKVGADGFLRVHLVFKLLALLLLTEVLLVPFDDGGMCNNSTYTNAKVRRAHSEDGVDISILRRFKIENLKGVEGCRSRESDIRLALLECACEVNPDAL